MALVVVAAVVMGAGCSREPGAKVLGVVYERGATGSIAGAVTSDGAPVRHADLLLQGPGAQGRVRTGGNGTYRIDGLQPGSYWVVATGSGESVEVTVSPNVVSTASFVL